MTKEEIESAKRWVRKAKKSPLCCMVHPVYYCTLCKRHQCRPCRDKVRRFEITNLCIDDWCGAYGIND